MNVLTLIASAINASSINPEQAHDPRSTAKKSMQSQDFSVFLVGLTRMQEDLIYCKYLGVSEHYYKLQKSFRGLLYRNKDFMTWVKCQDDPERFTDAYADKVLERTSNSPILQGLAVEQAVGCNRCGTCLGAGRWDIPESGVKAFDCEECKGTGFSSATLSAQYRADRLHVSLSSYWRHWDKPLKHYYINPLIRQETEALMKIQDNWTDSRQS